MVFLHAGNSYVYSKPSATHKTNAILFLLSTNTLYMKISEVGAEIKFVWVESEVDT